MGQVRLDVQRLAMIGYCIGLLAAMLAIAELSGVRIAYATFQPIGLIVLMLALCWLYAGRRQMPAVQTICEFVLASTLISIAILFYSYATVRPALPLVDPLLANADAMIGFHVPSVVAWIDQSRLLSWTFELTYNALGPQLLALPIALALWGRRQAACDLLLGYALICVAGCTISIYFPAIEAFAHYGIGISDLKHLSGAFGYHFHASFFAARHDEVFVLPLGMTSGVISFPSIHAALAILCGYMAWQLPLLRYPGFVLNALMFVSTVPVGAHYAVETLTGGMLACAVIWAMRAFQRPSYRGAYPAAIRSQPELAPN